LASLIARLLFDRLLFGRLLSKLRRPAPAQPPPMVPLFPPRTAPPLQAALTPAPVVRADPDADLFHVRAARGQWLGAANGQVVMIEGPDVARALVAVVPHANRQILFLLAPDLAAIAVAADGMEGPLVSAFRLQTESAEALRLRHPLSPNRFLGTLHEGAGANDGYVTFDSLGQTRFDRFTLVPVQAAALPVACEQAVAELCGAIARPFRAATLLDRLHFGAVRSEFVEALIRLLPRDELAILARRLMDQPEDLVLLRHAMPGNVWFSTVLPGLATWRAQRASLPPGGVLHSPRSDECAADPIEGYSQPQAGFVLTALARGDIAPSRGVCLLAAARNEGPYLLEWLAHHRAAGFAHAFIYTNDNFDGSNALLQALAQGGAITLVDNRPGTGCGPQYKAYAHALTMLPQILDYRWAAVLDIDEYFAFDTSLYGGVEEYLAWQETQPVDAVALCWLMFAGARDDFWHDTPTTARFPLREPGVNRHVKSIFRPRKFWGAQPHFPHATLNDPFVFRTEGGGIHHHAGVTDRIPAFAAPPTANHAWVNHYWLRSAPETLWKLARGHGDWKGNREERHLEMAIQLCTGFTTLAARTDLVEDVRIQHCAPGSDRELAALRALPGVAQADAQILDAFTPRLARMAAAFVEQARPGEEPPAFGPFREVLRALLATGWGAQAAAPPPL
jgi:hypothetical protein